jgi:hypothetical protein
VKGIVELLNRKPLVAIVVGLTLFGLIMGILGRRK